MAQKTLDTRVLYLLTNQAADLAVGDGGNTEGVVIPGGSGSAFVDVFSDTSSFDGGTVNIYKVADSGAFVLLGSFDSTSGQLEVPVGDIDTEVKAELTGTAAGAADVSVTVTA